jgi:hypothetical protein
MTQNETSPYQDHSRWFAAFAGGLFVLNVLLGVVSVPSPQAAMALGFLVGAVYIAAPLAGLFMAASGSWTFGKAALWLTGGVALHAGMFLAGRALPPTGLLTVFSSALGQTGLLVWAAGLGVLVSLLFREKNIIVPVCIFLAGFDAWLIFNPHVFTSQLVQQNSQVFRSVAMKVPAPKAAPSPEAKPEDRAPKIIPLAFIGPADLIFSMTFFAVLFRFKMKVKETLRWLVPVLIGYLVLVFAAPGGMLPALVPIGITILLVNRGEFKLNTEEKQSVWLVTALSLGLAAWGIYARITYKPPARPAGPVPQAVAPSDQESPGMPSPGGPGQSPSPAPPAQAGRPSPP